MSETALVFGATGMIGSYLLEELLKNPDYNTVKVFVRKPVAIQHPKLKQIITDFHSLDQIQSELLGDVLFCCLGTTIKNTPSQEGRRFVDKEVPVQLAALAAANKIPSFFIISSAGASAKASNFYIRVKGEMEAEVAKFNINQIVFMRPSFLLGERKEYRVIEGVMSVITRLLAPLMIGSLQKYRPVQGRTVARAMISLAGRNNGTFVVEFKEIRDNGQ